MNTPEMRRLERKIDDIYAAVHRIEAKFDKLLDALSAEQSEDELPVGSSLDSPAFIIGQETKTSDTL